MIQERIHRGRALLAIAGCLSLAIPSSADHGVPLDDGAAGATNDTSPSMTINGEVFCRAVVTTNPTGLKIKHSKGVCLIDYMEMTESERDSHGYDAVNYLVQKSIEQERTQRSETIQRERKDDDRIRKESEHDAVTVEIELRARVDDHMIAGGVKVVRGTKVVDEKKVFHGLKGPGMADKNTSLTVKKKVPSEEREPLPGEIAVVDRGHRFTNGTRWSGVLYPTGLSYQGRPEYTFDLADVPTLRRLTRQTAPVPPVPAPLSAWGAMVKGALHGFTLPLRFWNIQGLSFLEKDERTFAYWAGLVIGVCGLLMAIVTLFFKKAK